MRHQILLPKSVLILFIVLVIVLVTGCAMNPAADATSTTTVQDASQGASENTESDADAESAEHTEDEEHAAGEDHADSAEHAENEDHAAGEAHEGEDHKHLPNDGAVIRIVSPVDGATFGVEEDIVVEIETENFVLGEEGRHWELYVDGDSWGSIEGGNQDEVVRGLEPGEHEITAYLSLGSHEQLAEGSTIQITVEE